MIISEHLHYFIVFRFNVDRSKILLFFPHRGMIVLDFALQFVILLKASLYVGMVLLKRMSLSCEILN